MKIVIEHLASIEGVEIYAIIALLIFFVFFIVMLLHTLKIDKQSVKAWGNIPLEDDDRSTQEL